MAEIKQKVSHKLNLLNLQPCLANISNVKISKRSSIEENATQNQCSQKPCVVPNEDENRTTQNVLMMTAMSLISAKWL
jgi:hypothetical protein